MSGIKELQHLSLVAISFPAIMFFAVGTALLRHDAKLMLDLRSYTQQKLQIERATGVLEAAQFAAQDLEKGLIYVEETFTLIRDRLLLSVGDLKRDSEDSDLKGGARESTDATGQPGMAIDVIRGLKDLIESAKSAR